MLRPTSRTAKKVAKVLTKFKPTIFSRHPTHDVLRDKGRWPYFNFRSVIRLGSETARGDDWRGVTDTRTNGGQRVEINTVQAVLNSSSKIRMKQKFDENNIQTADWFMMIAGDNTHLRDMQNGGNRVSTDSLQYPVLAKRTHGSRGEGMRKLDNARQLNEFLREHSNDDQSYIIERYYNYSKEYRIHVTRSGAFYVIQKKLRTGTPTADRYYRNDDNSVWITEYAVERRGDTPIGLSTRRNPAFEVPSNLPAIKTAAVSALNAVGLDIGAIDVRVQSNRDRRGSRTPEFVILETNSAPSFGTVTAIKYLEVLPELLRQKHQAGR